jgi:methylphosphotriester-DNA--protein-cysteine methyltransferase
MKTYKLLTPSGVIESEVKGQLGGYKPGKIYGRLDCPSALRWLAKGHYAKHRVFFRDESTAIACGYRPCAVCLPLKYKQWKSAQR